MSYLPLFDRDVSGVGMDDLIGSVGGLEVEKFSYTHMPDYRDDITAVDYTAFSGREVPGDIEVEAHPEPPFTESNAVARLIVFPFKEAISVPQIASAI